MSVLRKGKSCSKGTEAGTHGACLRTHGFRLLEQNKYGGEWWEVNLRGSRVADQVGP